LNSRLILATSSSSSIVDREFRLILTVLAKVSMNAVSSSFVNHWRQRERIDYVSLFRLLNILRKETNSFDNYSFTDTISTSEIVLTWN